MKNKLFLFILILPFIFILTCCAAPKSEESEKSAKPEISAAPDVTPSSVPTVIITYTIPEYKKITQQQAREMMAGGAVILDVRTQGEFDDGHIPDAVLLPYNEIGEKAESVFPDKNATILVYCRTGVRSEIAARALIDMGYTGVYDFGGIVDWTGEIVGG